MQLILLSGGSGKRLWPLSNNARSKQFLPLLEKENGEMESMVQRVVRQAQEANLTNDITLATNASQLDIIQNQLGRAGFCGYRTGEAGYFPCYRFSCKLSETEEEM